MNNHSPMLNVVSLKLKMLFFIATIVKHNIKKSKDNINGTSNVDKKTFIEQVEYIKQQIADGEIMQAVLSKEVTFEGHYDPLHYIEP